MALPPTAALAQGKRLLREARHHKRERDTHRRELRSKMKELDRLKEQFKQEFGIELIIEDTEPQEGHSDQGRDAGTAG